MRSRRDRAQADAARGGVGVLRRRRCPRLARSWRRAAGRGTQPRPDRAPRRWRTSAATWRRRVGTWWTDVRPRPRASARTGTSTSPRCAPTTREGRMARGRNWTIALLLRHTAYPRARPRLGDGGQGPLGSRDLRRSRREARPGGVPGPCRPLHVTCGIPAGGSAAAVLPADARSRPEWAGLLPGADIWRPSRRQVPSG